MDFDLGSLLGAALRGGSAFVQGRLLGHQQLFERDQTEQAAAQRAQQIHAQQALQDLMFKSNDAYRQQALQQNEAYRRDALAQAAQQAEAARQAAKDRADEARRAAQERADADRASREAIAAQGNDTRRALATLAHPGGLAPAKPLRPTDATAVANLQTAIDKAGKALESFTAATAKGQNVTGPITGRVLAPVQEALGLASPESMTARRDLAAAAAEIRHALAGSALTRTELQALQPFIPDQKQSEEKILNSLQGLVDNAKATLTGRLRALEAAGYDVSHFGPGPAPTPGPTPSPAPIADPERDRALAAIRNGKDPVAVAALYKQRTGKDLVP